MSVVQAEHVIKLLLSTLSHYQETLIPFAMGMEPDYQKTCREYNEMKLSDMDSDDEDKAEEDADAPAEEASSAMEEEESAAEDEEVQGEECCDEEAVDEDKLEELQRIIDGLFSAEQSDETQEPIEAQESEDFIVEDVAQEDDFGTELIDEELGAENEEALKEKEVPEDGDAEEEAL